MYFLKTDLVISLYEYFNQGNIIKNFIIFNFAISTTARISFIPANVPKTVDQLGSTSPLFSESPGNAPLWITHSREKYYNEVYVNNARLLISQSNIKGKTAAGKEQVKRFYYVS